MRHVMVTVVFLLGLTACGGGNSVPSVPVATGSLTITVCQVPENGTDCAITISWTSSNATAPQVLAGDEVLATTASGSVTYDLGLDPVTISLLNGESTLDLKPVAATCVVTADWDGDLCEVVAETFTEFAPMDDGGNPITLEMVFYKPLGAGPFPTVMFNHGSTGTGSSPALFTVTYSSDSVVEFFTRRGWAVVFPQRRGRGQSGGLYDEGFTPTRSGYSCVAAESLPGVDYALEAMDAALTHAQGHAVVDATQILSGGFSRGGMLALVHAAETPGAYVGAVNFVGGWLAEGCGDHATVNRNTFLRGAPFPEATIWIYGDFDSFYSVPYSEGHFDAFITDGGEGDFYRYFRDREPDLDGHFVINDRYLWEADLDAYLDALP